MKESRQFYQDCVYYSIIKKLNLQDKQLVVNISGTAGMGICLQAVKS